MKKCLYCRTEIKRKEWQGKKRIIRESFKRLSKRKFCDNQCRSKHLSITNSGENNYFYGKKLTPWNKKPDHLLRIKTGKGYIYVRYYDKQGNRKIKYEHRMLMERKIGRLLRPEEVVHHIDENPENNDISNLMLFANDREHKRHHKNQVLSSPWATASS